MKVRELMDLLSLYDEEDELQIEVYETATGKYVDTTADITVSEERNLYCPTLRIDI